MPDPDKTRPTEVDLEIAQRERLMDLFSLVKTYDGRESVIAFCEKIIFVGQAD